MKQQTLLDKARSITPKQTPFSSEEELDLMIALINREITASQAGAALGKKHSTAVGQRCFSVLRYAIATGEIARIERIPTKNGK